MATFVFLAVVASAFAMRLWASSQFEPAVHSAERDRHARVLARPSI